MPPLKQPQSLVTLSTSAVVQLVKISVENMEDMTSPALDEALNKVQEVFVDGVLPAMWDSLYEAVLDYYFTNDLEEEDCYPRVCSIFIHENLRKLTPNYDISEDLIYKLENLVELDAYIWDFEPRLLALVGQVCLNIQIVCLEKISVPESWEALARCSRLRSLTYHTIRNESDDSVEFTESSAFIAAKLALDLFPCLVEYSYYHMGKVLLHLNTTKPLNLRFVKEVDCSELILDRILALCPHLQELSVFEHNYKDVCSRVFEALASSSLKIRRLDINVKQFDEHFRHFIERKGIHLLHLHLACPPLPEREAQLMAKCCTNLKWFVPRTRET